MVSLIRSEAQFLALVKDAAEKLGYKVYHTYDSRRSNEGFPDLVMLRNGRQVVAELKMPGKTPTREQLDWLAEFAFAGAEAFWWAPEDWEDDTISEVLR